MGRHGLGNTNKKGSGSGTCRYRSEPKDGLGVGWTESRNSQSTHEGDSAAWSAAYLSGPDVAVNNAGPLYFLRVSYSKNRGRRYQTIDTATVKFLRTILAIDRPDPAVGG
jgi:hypothetical protein